MEKVRKKRGSLITGAWVYQQARDTWIVREHSPGMMLSDDEGAKYGIMSLYSTLHQFGSTTVSKRTRSSSVSLHDIKRQDTEPSCYYIVVARNSYDHRSKASEAVLSTLSDGH